MTISDATGLINSIANLIGVLIWPAALIAALFLLAEPIKHFIASLSEFTFKGAGFEASAKRKTEAAAALGVALAKQTGQQPEMIAEQTRLVSHIVDSVSPRSVREAEKATILWVDDVPGNNVYERRALEAVGFKFVLASSTDEALDLINKQPFRLIISDLGRPSDRMAGITLLEKLRASGNTTPYIIYGSARALTIREEAQRKGAFDVTNRPDELFQLVVAAAGQSS